MKKPYKTRLIYLILAVLLTPCLAYGNVGGPDSYGYSWIDSKSPSPSITNSWIDISSTGTDSGIYGDDTYRTFGIGFNFNYYGNTYSSVNISSNGYFSFTDGASAYSNTSIPYGSTPNNIVAPFWDDLYIAYGATIRYQTTGTAPNRIFVVQWSNSRFCCSDNGSLTFQIVLYETSNAILFQYKSLSDTSGGGRATGNSNTVGIENSSGTIGLLYSYNRIALEPNLAIMFTRQIDVSAVSPAVNATNISLNENIKATFNQALNPDSLTESSISVTGTTSGSIAGQITYLPLQNSLEFDPAVDFRPGETITVTLGTAIRSVTGSTLAAPYTWSFTTGISSDTEAPSPITGLAVVDVPNDAGGKIQVAWSATSSDDLAYYRVYRNNIPFTTVASLTPVNATSQTTYIDSTVDGVSYYYAVTAVDTSGNENMGVQTVGPVISVNDPPAIPIGLSGSTSANGINLYWSANNTADLAGYKVYFGTASGSYGSPVVLGKVTSYELTGFQNCTNYYIAITAYDTGGVESGYSSQIIVNSGSAVSPGTPTGLTAAAADGAITIRWNQNPECDISSYYIYRSTTSGSGYTYIASNSGASNTSYQDLNIAHGVVYYYTVIARDNFGLSSPYSQEASAVAVNTSAPPVPYSLSTSPSYGGVTLYWSESSSGDIAGYKIYYGTASGAYIQTVTYPRTYTGGQSYGLTGLTDCTNYYLAVSAYDLSGNESARSSEIVFNSGQAGSPSAPTGLTALAEESRITLVWNANPECDIRYYYVYRRTSSTSYSYIGSTTSTTYIDQAVANGTTYYYALIAFDQPGYSSSYSAEASAVAIDTTPPAAPRNFTVYSYAGTNYLYMTWTYNSEPDIAGYKIYYGTSSGNYTQTVSAGNQNYNYLYGLQGCTPYYLVVKAVDLSGLESGVSQEGTGTASGSSSLQTPTGIAISSAESVITLSWNANPECDIYGYRVYRSTTSGTGYQEIAYVRPGTSYLDRNIANGTRYYYAVKAYSYAGVGSAYSSEVNALAIDTTPPQQPSWASASPSDTYIDASWGASSSADLKEYRVYYGTQPGTYTASITTTATSYRFSNLSNCTSYYIAVKAVDLTGLISPYSQEASARTYVAGIPAAPVGLATVGANNAAQLSWSANSECDVNGYRIYRTLTAGTNYSYIGTTTGTTFNDSNLQSETTYYYVVKAVDTTGQVSNGSNEVSVTTLDTTPPTQPVVDPSLFLYSKVSGFTLRGSKEANSSIIINGTQALPVTSGTTWEASVTLSQTDNYFNLTSKDPAGNVCAAVQVKVTWDTQPAQIATSNPANGYSTNQNITAITITLSDALSGVDINASLPGAAVQNQQNTDMPGQWAASGANGLVFTATAPMPEGVYTATIHPVDKVGNGGTTSITFTIDQTPPAAPTITNIATPTKQASQIMSGTRSSDTNTILVKVNGTLQNVVSYPTASTWQATIAGFVENENTITVIAKDAAGNSSETSVILMYDSTPPSTPVVQQPSGPTKESTFTLTGTKEANSSILVGNTVAVPLDGATNWQYQVSLSKEGQNNFSLTSKDAVGNQSPAATATVVRDTTPPVIASSTPAANSFVNNAGTVSVVLSDVYSPVDLQASLIGAVVKNAVTNAVVNGSWSINNGTLAFTPSASPADGRYSLTLAAQDNLGNTGTVSFTFTLDTALPVVQSLVMNPASPHKAETVTMSVIFNEDMLTSLQPVLSFSRGLLYSTYLMPNGSWTNNRTWQGSYTFTTGNGDGSYSVKITGAKDKSGNAMNDASIPDAFVLDTTAPEAPGVNKVTTPTNNPNQTLSGSKEAGAALFINGVLRVPWDANTTWSYSYPLVENSNTLSVTTRDAAWNDSAATAVVVVLDSTPPVFTVNTYQNPSATATQTLTGTKEPGCIVKISGTQIYSSDDASPSWSYTVNLISGITNHFVFTAADALGNTTTKVVDILYDNAPPAALGPGVLVANGSGKGTDVALSWAAYPETTDVAYYAIYKSSTAFTDVAAMTPIGTVNKGTKTYKVTGLTQGSTYYFAVVPVDLAGNQINSVNTASAVPMDAAAPEDVTNLAGAAGYTDVHGNFIVLTWTVSANSMGDLADQVVYLDSGMGYDTGTPVGKTASSYTKEGLNDATKYKFKLTVKDNLGHESQGGVIEAVTRLGNPASLSTTPSSGKIALTWASVTSPYLKEYRVYRSTGAASQSDIGSMTRIATVAKTATSFTDTGLVNDQTYQYAVTVMNTSGAERTDVQSVSGTPRADSTGPVIDAFNIVAGQVVTGPITITATAHDLESAMASMELLIDGTTVATQNGASISWFWNAVAATDGNHTITLKATDSKGNATEDTRQVILSLAPPSLPAITGHVLSQTAPTYLVNVSGTAPLFTTVTLRVNGVVVGQTQTAGTTGTGTFTFSSVALVEGDNVLAAKAGHRGGESAYTSDYKILVDTGAPSSPQSLAAQVLPGGLIRFTWTNGSGEMPTGYNLYRGTSPFTSRTDAGVTKANTSSITYQYNEYNPGNDSLKYYAVTAIDGAGNESGLSNVVSISSDRTPPSILNIQYRQNSAVIAPGSSVGVGSVIVSFAVSESLKELPFFSLEPQEGTPIVVTMNKVDDTHYEGTFAVSAQSPQGPTTYKFSGKDMIGNRGNAQGTGITIDVKGPEAAVQTPLSTLQITADPVAVALVLNEPSVTTPVLTLTAADGTASTANGMTSTDNGVHWSGTIDVSAMPEGKAEFVLAETRDALGNTGTTVSAGRYILLYRDQVPSPGIPEGLTAKSEKAGVVTLTWYPVVYDPQNNVGGTPITYNVYRRAENDQSAIKIKTGIAGSPTQDTPPADGTYFYSVTSVGLMGSESPASGEIQALSDRTGPPAPANLALSLGSGGVTATWDAVTDTQPLKGYHLYRSNSSFTSSTGLTPVVKTPISMAVDTSPSKTYRFYAVASVDSLGNEGPLSEVMDIDFPVSPVRSLVLQRIDDAAPTITWLAPQDGNIAGYHIYRNGSRITPYPVPNLSYTDAYAVVNTIYGVSVMDNLGNESPIKQVTLPDLSMGIKDSTTLRRGLLETLQIVLASGQGNGFTIDSLDVKIGTATTSSILGPFALGANTTLQLEKIAATTADALSPVSVFIQANWSPSPGVTINVSRTTSAEVLGSSSSMEIFNDLLVRNTDAKVRLKMNNLGTSQMEIVTSENNTRTTKVRVNLKDQDGNLLSTGYLDQRIGSSIVNGAGYAVARINPNETFLTDPITLPVPVSAPYKVMIEAVIENTYYHYAKTDQVTAPGMKGNFESTIQETPYRATAAPEKTFYTMAQPVVINGSAISNDPASNGQLAPNVSVKLGISVNGFDRFYTVTTDASGRFSYTFTPGSSEAGNYSVWAVHPDVKDRTVQASFSIAGISISPTSANVKLARNRSIDIPVTISNFGGGSLTGLAFETTSSSGITTGVINAGDTNLTAGEKQAIAWRLTADSNAPDTGWATFKATTAEGLTVTLNASITMANLIPIISTSPSYIDTGMVRGDQKIATFTITNSGQETLKNARIEGPSTSWMSLTQEKTIGDIAPGTSRSVSFMFRPPSTLAQAVYDDQIIIYSDNHIPYTYHVQVTVSSNAVGSVFFTVQNMLAEHLPDTTITFQHQLLTDLLYTVKTGPDGTVMKYDIPEGRYSYTVTPPTGHLPSSGTFTITPGMTTTASIVLEVKLVDVTWSVVPITIQDKYEIKITQTFATNVPLPVLVTDPPVINMPDIQPGQVFNGEFTVTNYGLIAAVDVKVSFPSSFLDYDIEVFKTSIPTRIAAQQKITVPFRVTRRQQVAAVNFTQSDAGTFACSHDSSLQLFATSALFNEVRGYGAGCVTSFSIGVSGTSEICPVSGATANASTGGTVSIPTTCPTGGGGGYVSGGGGGYGWGGGGGQGGGGAAPGQPSTIQTGNPCECKPDKTACPDDGNICTDDYCMGEQCSHPNKDCDDKDKCTDDSCDPATGCKHIAKQCDDGQYCTSFDGKSPGADQCDPSSGTCYQKKIEDKETSPISTVVSVSGILDDIYAWLTQHEVGGLFDGDINYEAKNFDRCCEDLDQILSSDLKKISGSKKLKEGTIWQSQPKLITIDGFPIGTVTFSVTAGATVTLTATLKNEPCNHTVETEGSGSINGSVKGKAKVQSLVDYLYDFAYAEGSVSASASGTITVSSTGEGKVLFNGGKTKIVITGYLKGVGSISYEYPIFSGYTSTKTFSLPW